MGKLYHVHYVVSLLRVVFFIRLWFHLHSSICATGASDLTREDLSYGGGDSDGGHEMN